MLEEMNHIPPRLYTAMAVHYYVFQWDTSLRGVESPVPISLVLVRIPSLVTHKISQPYKYIILY